MAEDSVHSAEVVVGEFDRENEAQERGLGEGKKIWRRTGRKGNMRRKRRKSRSRRRRIRKRIKKREKRKRNRKHIRSGSRIRGI